MPDYMEYAENNKNEEYEENNKHCEDEDSEESYKINKEEEEQFKQELIKVSSLQLYAYQYLQKFKPEQT